MANQADNNDRFCDLHSILSIQQNINQTDSNKLAFLVLSGSFNPVHTQHIRAFMLVRKYLESLEWIVAGGFLAPSSDDHVQSKLQAGMLPLKRRIDLCRLAIEEFDWLHVCQKGEFSSKWVCQYVRTELEHECFKVLKGRHLTGVEIMGSDAVVRIFDKMLKENSREKRKLPKQKRIICCLLRRGPGSTTHRKWIEDNLVPNVVNLGIELMIIDPVILNFPLEEVSSSNIRGFIAKGDWETLQSTGRLHPDVLKALRAKD